MEENRIVRRMEAFINLNDGNGRIGNYNINPINQ